MDTQLQSQSFSKRSSVYTMPKQQSKRNCQYLQQQKMELTEAMRIFTTLVFRMKKYLTFTMKNQDHKDFPQVQNY